MPKEKKFFLLHERRETWRIRLEKNRRGFCEPCLEETAWLTAAEAASISDLSEREIYRLAENGRLHFAESDTRLLFFCRRSLEALSRREVDR